MEAYRLFERAEKEAPGPAQDRLWREAAEAYRAELARGPDRVEAPEAAINGAHAWKQVGGYAEAVAMYELFLRAYGSEPILARLEKSDSAKLAARILYVDLAASALAAAHFQSLDHARAAVVFGQIAANARLPAGRRREAALNEAHLRVGLRDLAAAKAAREVFVHLDPPPEKVAEIDWALAQLAVRAWDERAPDAGDNRAARRAALAEVERYLARYERARGAERFAVHAAYEAARMRSAGGDRRAEAACTRLARAFARFRDAAPVREGKSTALGSPEEEMAGLCKAKELPAVPRAKRAGMDLARFVDPLPQPLPIGVGGR